MGFSRFEISGVEAQAKMNARIPTAAIFLIPIALIVGSALLIPCVNAQETSVSLYGGIGSAAPLTSILRLRELGIEPKYITTLAIARGLSKNLSSFGLEIEGQTTWHFGGGPLALNGVLIGRFRETPWGSTLGGSVGLGIGLSYSFGIPPLEDKELARTSRTLLYLMFDYEFDIGTSPWSALFRIHHRSGAFGFFNNVTGGSDYLCIGAKYHW